MGHPLCCIHNYHRQPLVAVLVDVAEAVGVEQAVEVAGAAHVEVDVAGAVGAEQAVEHAVEVDAAGVVPDLPGRRAVCMTGKCGSTTVDIVLHNSIDYYKLDIGSFLFLHPSKRVNSENNTGIKT